MFCSSINIYLYNLVLSGATLRCPAACYCPFPLIYICTIWYCQKKHWDIKRQVIVLLHLYIPVLYTIVRRNTKIYSCILFSLSINTYLRNMVLSFSISTYCYNIVVSEETLRYPVAYHFPSPLRIPVQYDIIRRNTKISNSMLFFFINIYHYN
jgi:hypothetical protein